MASHCACAANQHRIPLYPIFTGRNLTYGASAPVYSGSVALDPKRINRVPEVNERDAYALVEPGVSYVDLYEHITKAGSTCGSILPTRASASSFRRTQAATTGDPSRRCP